MQTISFDDCERLLHSYVDVLTYESFVAIGIIFFMLYFIIRLSIEIRKHKND